MTTAIESEWNKCHYCGYQGKDVNKYGSEHVGGKVDLDFRMCDDAKECARRVAFNVLLKESTDAIMEYGEIKDDIDPEKVAKEIIDDTLELVKKHLL